MYVGDHEEVIREEAMKMLQVEDEEHPTFLDNRLVQGIEEASLFQLDLFGRPAPTESELLAIHLNVCMYVSMYVCMYVCVYLCLNVCVYICVYVCMYVYVCVYLCMHLSMYVCMYVFIFICVCMYVCV